MTTFRCVDGPLAGQLVARRRLPPVGRALTVGELDVGHAVLAVEYRLDGAAGAGGAPSLRFVGAREVRRPRRGFDRLRPAVR